MLVEICVLDLSFTNLCNTAQLLEVPKVLSYKFQMVQSKLKGFHENERLSKLIEMLQWITSSQVLTK